MPPRSILVVVFLLGMPALAVRNADVSISAPPSLPMIQLQEANISNSTLPDPDHSTVQKATLFNFNTLTSVCPPIPFYNSSSHKGPLQQRTPLRLQESVPTRYNVTQLHPWSRHLRRRAKCSHRIRPTSDRNQKIARHGRGARGTTHGICFDRRR